MLDKKYGLGCRVTASLQHALVHPLSVRLASYSGIIKGIAALSAVSEQHAARSHVGLLLQAGGSSFASNIGPIPEGEVSHSQMFPRLDKTRHLIALACLRMLLQPPTQTVDNSY